MQKPEISIRRVKSLFIFDQNLILFRQSNEEGPVSKTVLALFLAIAVSWASATSLWAQASKRSIYPKGFEVTTDWQYSCPDGKGCSFNCPGSGGANNVTKLSIFLGSVPIGKNANTAGIFYEFTSTQTLRGSGFAVTTGIGTLACQVQGMTLD
jgi:hypothetical protein